MNRKILVIICFAVIVSILFIGCREDAETIPGPEPEKNAETAVLITKDDQESPEMAVVEPGKSAGGILFSEVLPGIEGANNHEFIELYNSGETYIDLNGYSLLYVTREGQEPEELYSWSETAEIPAFGHYLLVHRGEDFNLLPDGIYDKTLFEGKGGLLLRDAGGEVSDRLGWGDAPDGYFAGSPITGYEKGMSLERLPGGDQGNGQNSGDNAADLIAQPDPNPQNSGFPPTPLPEDTLAISLDYPEAIAPGSSFEIRVLVENHSTDLVDDVQVSLPLAGHFSLVESPAGSQVGEGRIRWPLGPLEPGEKVSSSLVLTAPMANIDTLFSGYYAQAAGLPRAYGELVVMVMDGSAIPIAVARSLPSGSLVTVEGLVTMYPGGFFAGSSSAKFYLEDESGGVQVFADGGAFDVTVDIGDRTRVTGVTELYRDSLEVIPRDNVADIQILEKNQAEPVPTAISILQNETDDSVLGRLNVIEGQITRIEEFTYHYEVDLQDETGHQTLLYMEKDAGLNDQDLRLGASYRVTGISELASNVRQLKPRRLSDFVEIFPPELILSLDGPSNILPGQMLTVTISAINYTAAPITNVRIIAGEEAALVQEWQIPEIAADGGREEVTFLVEIPQDAVGVYLISSISATADQWPEPVTADTHQVYIGEGVPIWALQGDGSRSPFIGERVTVIGQVTGIFPAMDGFFMQSRDPDGDEATSDGIFVALNSFGQGLEIGDVVEVNGRVWEEEGQTILRPASPQYVVQRDNETPATITPVIYDPPADPDTAAVYKESLEGMLVTINQPAVVVGPSNGYGEFMLVYEKWDTDLVRRTDNQAGFVMWVDDATFNSHDDQRTLPVAVARGDVLLEVTGPLAYTFGNYKIAPLADPLIETRDHDIASIPEATGDRFAIATFNVENLFDAQIPHPDSPPRLSEVAYQARLDKVGKTIEALGFPAIIAMQEVENIGVLEDLAGKPLLAPYRYSAVLIEGDDSRGIDVGYLVREDRVTIEDFSALPAPGALFSRPPLMLRVTVHLDGGDQQLILLNNHFLSLSAGELQTEPVRNNQAAWNSSLAEQLAADFPAAQVIVLGDLNSFYQTLPLETLQAGGLRHAYEFFDDPEDLPYTYIFEGSAQTLDHILMSPDLFEKVIAVEALHSNADFPIPDPDDESIRRVSDHDPLLVIFDFE